MRYENTVKNITHFSEKISHKPDLKKYLELRIDTEENLHDRLPLPSALRSATPTGQAANTGFSVTKNFKFLYKIGKTCAKYGIELEEGAEALKDYLALEMDQDLCSKARHWQEVIYKKQEKTPELEEMLKN